MVVQATKDWDMGGELPVAQVETVKFEALRIGDSAESDKLFRACRTHGFFYLDFSGTGTDVEIAINDIYKLESELFDLPEEELLRFDIDVLSPKKKLNGFVTAP